MLHQSGLYFHMLALLLVGAGGIGGAIVEHQFWKYASLNAAQAKSVLPILKITGKFIKAGIIVFLVSGLIMLYSTHWIYLTQVWFIVKFLLFLLLPIRGALIADPTFKKIGAGISGEKPDPAALKKWKSKMNRFHFIQYGIVLTIIFLVIFKV